MERKQDATPPFTNFVQWECRWDARFFVVSFARSYSSPAVNCMLPRIQSGPRVPEIHGWVGLGLKTSALAWFRSEALHHSVFVDVSDHIGLRNAEAAMSVLSRCRIRGQLTVRQHLAAALAAQKLLDHCSWEAWQSWLGASYCQPGNSIKPADVFLDCSSGA